jgi:predicted MFS family arabinose efflux permease
VLFDLASYLVSAAAIALVRQRGVARVRVPGGAAAGLSVLLRSRVLSGLLLVSFAFWTANAVFTALLVPFMTVRFGHRPGLLGAQLSALGAGYLLGGPLAGRLVRDRSPALPLLISLAGVGGCFAVLANAPTALVAVLATGAAGLPGSALLVVIETTIQRATPPGVRGRVGAAFFASDAAAALAGALVGAWLGPGVLTASAGVVLLVAIGAPLAVGRYSVRPNFASILAAIGDKFAAHRPSAGRASKSSVRRRIWARGARSLHVSAPSPPARASGCDGPEGARRAVRHGGPDRPPRE